MSINRISSNTINDNGVFHLRNREYSMDKVNNQINTGKKNRLPRENVVDVTQSMTYHTKISKIDQYIRNIDDAEAERGLVEVKLNESIQILQRARELAVQSANGTYTEEDRKSMAIEIDQLLRQIVQDSNTKFKGDFLFSGFQKYTKPFEALEGAVKGINDAMITKVKYLGDNGVHLREVDAGEYVGVSKPGSEVYWAENFQIYSPINTANFRLTKDQNILIDGIKIEFKEGDNAYAVMDKINRSNAAINASIDMVNGGMILTTTKPHKPELADIEGGTLLQDLGILERGRAMGPENFNPDATVFGGSIFDTLIGLRDSMIHNNSEDIGGRFLGALDFAISNLTYNMAETGAKDNRLAYLSSRHTDDKIVYTEALTKTEDIDLAEAITELKMLDFAHKAALSSLARLAKTSLMDFLR